MTTTVEPPRTAPDAYPRSRARAQGRQGFWPRLRVELRLAARQARRAGATSALIVALVALPMTLIVGAVTIGASKVPGPGQLITSELGQTRSWVRVVGGEDPSRSQLAGEPYAYSVDTDDDGRPIHPELPPPSDPAPLLAGVELLEVARADLVMRTPEGETRITGIVGDAADPRLEGRYELIDGRRPVDATEAAVSPGALERLGARLGDTLTLTEPEVELRIVGVMKEATEPNRTLFAFVAAPVVPDEMIAPNADRVWFAPDWQPSVTELAPLNRAGFIVYARDLVAAAEASTSSSPAAEWGLVSGATVVGGFTAYLVVLLAGAGFAVSAKRQERSLAMAASVGAGRGSLFRIVVLQGTVLGLIGGIVGAVLGPALALPFLVLFDDGSAGSFWGFHVPWWGVLAVLVFATAVGTASALLPARAATKGDVLASLRGSRRPARLRAKRPVWGTLLGAIGVGLTCAGAIGLTSLNAAEPIDYGNPMRIVFLCGIVAGPVLFQIGAIVSGHWLLTVIARLAGRLGLAPRIAARDAAANPSRIVPAFAAIAACVFIASFALSMVGVQTAQQSRDWSYQAPLGSVVVSIWGDDERVRAAALEALERTDPDAVGLVRYHRTVWDPQDGAAPTLLSVEVQEFRDCATHPGVCMNQGMALFGNGEPYVVAPDDLTTVLGVPVDADVIESFAAGGAITTDPTYLDDGHMVVHWWDHAELDEYWQAGAERTPLPDPLESRRIAAELVSTEHNVPWPVILSPAAADAVGYETTVVHAVGAFAEAPTQQALDALDVSAAQPLSDGSGFTARYEVGPPSAEPVLWLILAAAGVLVLGAGCVALGLARVERRPDDATLAAVGASRGIRRRIGFWQAIIIVGIGSVTGTIAGIIPVWGIAMQSASTGAWELRMTDLPVLWLALLALGLPLVIAVASLLVPLRRPDLTRRTVIA